MKEEVMIRLSLILVILSVISCTVVETVKEDSSKSAIFDFSSYQHRGLSGIIEESKYYDPDKSEGQSLLIPPPKIHLYEKLSKFPFKCDGEPIKFMMTTVGIPAEKIPPMNTCMLIESEDGDQIGLFVQDSIAKYIEEEYTIGQEIHLWTLWLFVNSSDHKPYFVVNGIGPMP